MVEQARRPITPLVWRVTDSDLDTICPWLLPALQKRWPRLHTDGISFWFKSAIGDRRTLFIRTANVVGMWHSTSDILEPEPTVLEKFVRGTESAPHDEYVNLYRHMKTWAISIRARECVIGIDSDANMSTYIVPGLSTLDTPLKKRSIYYLVLTSEGI